MKKFLTLSIISLLLLAMPIFAEMEDDDADDAIEKAEKKIVWLAKKSKYKGFVLFADVQLSLDLIKKAKYENKEESNYEKSVLYAIKALVKGEIAEDNARIRYYQAKIDAFHLHKFGKEIKKQQIKLLVASAGLRKKGAVYKGKIDAKKIFVAKNRWTLTDNISADGSKLFEKIKQLLTLVPKASVRLEYGTRAYNKKISIDKADILKKYFTDQLGIKASKVKAEGRGNKLGRKDVLQISLIGVR